MKKIFTIFLMSLVLGSAIGQNFEPKTFKDGGITIDKATFKGSAYFNSNAKANERWYNFGETMDAFHGGSSVLKGNNLFPDSTILVNYGTSGYGGPWIHALGDVLDVSSIFFNDAFMHPGELAMNNSSTFTVDSISMIIIYDRLMNDPNVVDTLVFEVSTVLNLPVYLFAASAINTNLGADTVFINGIDYAHATNTMNIPTKKVYKFPLTEQVYADSLSNGLHIIDVATPGLSTVQAGIKVGVSVSFIPGYTWTPNVDSLEKKNSVFFISFKEQDGMFPFYNKGDLNVSYIIPQDVRYNDAGTWNGLYIPSFAYMGSTATYSYEHHLLYYKVTCLTGCNTTGTGFVADNQVILGDAYPNPASKGSSINIPVNSNATSKLTVRNIIGQSVMEIENITTGNQIIEINTTQLQSGVYLYTLESAGQVVTKKFTVSK